VENEFTVGICATSTSKKHLAEQHQQRVRQVVLAVKRIEVATGMMKVKPFGGPEDGLLFAFVVGL
jgi:hypothetical protein